jgi:hypothetical protein
MSFDLRIRFTGLMMWVPEDKSAMHVLMPSMTHVHDENHKDMPEHFARLVYDVAYTQPGQTQLARDYQMVDLTRSVLDFNGIMSLDGFDIHLPGELPDVAAVATRVDPILVTGSPDERLAARVTLRSGVMTDYELGAPYHYESTAKAQRITPATEWTIRWVGLRETGEPVSSLPPLVVRGPNGEQVLPELHPIGQTIHVEVFYVTSEFLPPHYDERFNPKDEGADSHFAGYYGLCIPSTASNASPRLPQAATAVPVNVRDRVEREGPNVPGSVCGQSKGTLG